MALVSLYSTAILTINLIVTDDILKVKQTIICLNSVRVNSTTPTGDNSGMYPVGLYVVKVLIRIHTSYNV